MKHEGKVREGERENVALSKLLDTSFDGWSVMRRTHGNHRTVEPYLH